MTFCRTSSSVCLHGMLGWASSTFPISESRNRMSHKSSSSGKHKLVPADTSRSSKSKVRKVTETAEEVHLPFAEPLLQLLPTIPPDKPSITSGSYPSEIQDSYFEDHLIDLPYGVEEEIPACTEEMVPHCYNPSFISDLDDYSLSECTDIG